jgi:pimeloyl-ACP methyl ester carboxylesterase
LSAPERFEIAIGDGVFDDLRDRLDRTRWAEQPYGGWELGVDADFLRELCCHWAHEYDPGRLPGLINRFGNLRWRGLHTIHEPGSGELPLLLLHGWPGGPIEYLELIPRLLEAGHEVAVPSMPGYAWSEDPGEPLNIAAVAARLR